MAIEEKVSINWGGLVGGIRAGIGLGGGGGGGMVGGLGKAIGGLGLLTGTMGIIAKGVETITDILISASGMLKGVLGALGKSLNQIIRPIGDILAVGLMPLLYILRPIGMFFNMMMRPYLQQAMKAMRAGGTFMAAGELGKASQAFSLGFAYLIKPIQDMAITAGFESAKLLLRGFQMLGDAVLSIIPIPGIRATWNAGMDALIERTDTMRDSVISGFSTMYDKVLEKIDAEAVNVAIAMSNPLKDVTAYAKNVWGPEFRAAIASGLSSSKSSGIGALKPEGIYDIEGWFSRKLAELAPGIVAAAKGGMSSKGLIP